MFYKIFCLLLFFVYTSILSTDIYAKNVLDINTANISELISLPGIGKKRAKDIISYRKIRRFKRRIDLLRVRGIGRKTYQKIKKFIRVSPYIKIAKK